MDFEQQRSGRGIQKWILNALPEKDERSRQKVDLLKRLMLSEKGVISVKTTTFIFIDFEDLVWWGVWRGGKSECSYKGASWAKGSDASKLLSNWSKKNRQYWTSIRSGKEERRNINSRVGSCPSIRYLHSDNYWRGSSGITSAFLADDDNKEKTPKYHKNIFSSSLLYL